MDQGPWKWALTVFLVGAFVIVVLDLWNIPSFRQPKTWIVQPGETLTLSDYEVHPDDLYRCPARGGVNGTPEPGHGVGGSGGFGVETAPDGTVIAHCEPGQPGNV